MLPEPPLENLDRFRSFAEGRGQMVRRHYDWGGEYTDENGEVQYVEPGWETLLVKEEMQADDRLVMHMTWIDDRVIELGWEQQWESLIWLNEQGFERTLEKEGYANGRINVGCLLMLGFSLAVWAVLIAFVWWLA